MFRFPTASHPVGENENHTVIDIENQNELTLTIFDFAFELFVIGRADQSEANACSCSIVNLKHPHGCPACGIVWQELLRGFVIRVQSVEFSSFWCCSSSFRLIACPMDLYWLLSTTEFLFDFRT